jgi:hypothetical protein
MQQSLIQLGYASLHLATLHPTWLLPIQLTYASLLFTSLSYDSSHLAAYHPNWHLFTYLATTYPIWLPLTPIGFSSSHLAPAHPTWLLLTPIGFS